MSDLGFHLIVLGIAIFLVGFGMWLGLALARAADDGRFPAPKPEPLEHVEYDGLVWGEEVRRDSEM